MRQPEPEHSRHGRPQHLDRVVRAELEGRTSSRRGPRRRISRAGPRATCSRSRGSARPPSPDRERHRCRFWRLEKAAVGADQHAVHAALGVDERELQGDRLGRRIDVDDRPRPARRCRVERLPRRSTCDAGRRGTPAAPIELASSSRLVGFMHAPRSQETPAARRHGRARRSRRVKGRLARMWQRHRRQRPPRGGGPEAAGVHVKSTFDRSPTCSVPWCRALQAGGGRA